MKRTASQVKELNRQRQREYYWQHREEILEKQRLKALSAEKRPRKKRKNPVNQLELIKIWNEELQEKLQDGIKDEMVRLFCELMLKWNNNEIKRIMDGKTDKEG